MPGGTLFQSVAMEVHAFIEVSNVINHANFGGCNLNCLDSAKSLSMSGLWSFPIGSWLNRHNSVLRCRAWHRPSVREWLHSAHWNLLQFSKNFESMRFSASNFLNFGGRNNFLSLAFTPEVHSFKQPKYEVPELLCAVQSNRYNWS